MIVNSYKKQFIFVCAAKVGQDIKYCKFVIKNKSMLQTCSNEKLSSLFLKKHGIMPEVINGPHIEYKNVKYSELSNYFWLCGSNSIGGVKLEEVVGQQDLSKEQIKLLKSKDGEEFSFVLGPFIRIESRQNKIVEPKINRSLLDLKLSAIQKPAEFNGWYGIANYIQDDPDNVLFIFLSPVDKSSTIKRNVPFPGKVKLENIKFELNNIQ